MESSNSSSFEIARDGEILGTYSADDLRTWLEDGQLSGEEWGWHEGMAEWLPVMELIEYPCATSRQRALLEFLGFELSPTLTETQAADAIDSAAGEPAFQDRLRHWQHERLLLQPALYAQECQAWKEGRAGEIFAALTQGEFEPLFSHLCVRDVAAVVAFLDQRVRGWDGLWQDREARGLNAAMLVDTVMPAFVLHRPDKIKTALHPGNIREEALRPTTRVAAEQEYWDELVELRVVI